ncbi:MAG: DUF1080 domain-containing protein [Tannerella sp.]|jgi:hypothetical protein|nr:DUF1080 domain-containing protein [Tannerella sp.]
MCKNLIIISVAILFLFACHFTPEKQTEKTVEVIKKITDPTYLFDAVSLDGWEITNFVLPGNVYVKNGEMLLEMGDGCTGITWMGIPPVMDYQISLDAKRIAGNDFFCGLTFPVHNEFCSLILGGWGGYTTGISCIDGMDASENETTGRMRFEENRWYHITLDVSAEKIKAMVDDQVIIDFEISKHRLSIRPEVSLNIPLGFATWHTTAALKNIRLVSNE